jgi:hypothetical protein
MPDSTTSPGATAPAAPRWLDEREHAAWRAFLSMKTQLDAHLAYDLRQDSGLSSADFAVLVGVSEAPGRRIRAHLLGAHLVWEKSRLSKQISRMEARGLVFDALTDEQVDQLTAISTAVIDRLGCPQALPEPD